MGPTLFIMAILGCGDAEALCREVRIASTPYPSAEACQAAMGHVLGRNLDLDFPTVLARCRPESAESARRTLASLPHG
ncbi:hypothetical protein [Sphingomonas quercus]|uniref:Uncharacterized protein n=1 Tax=Sphingomonas quercus TaxID=2842451 RepID=A0ABS6BH10_9SPHN|nr:hypothetical protein [Sphingomonas quercus]MBU3077082.1 hypothetical protein [Sphingomonas quercus]